MSIYIDHKRIAFHLRSYVKGHYTTVKDHLCSTHQHYLDRSPGYYIAKAKSRSEALHDLFVLLFNQDRYPEQLYRTCDGLLKLQRITEEDKFLKACQIAIENEQYNYGFVANILKNNMTEHQRHTEEKPLPKHENIRGKQSFY